MKLSEKVLFFVEDPGAANCIIGLPDILSGFGIKSLTLASGNAFNYMKEKKIPVEQVLTPNQAFSNLEEINPGIIVVGTSENKETLSHLLVDFGKKNNVCTVGILDSYILALERFKGVTDDPLFHAPDILIVPDKRSKKCFSDAGFSANNIHVFRNPFHEQIIIKRSSFDLLGKSAIRREVLPFVPTNLPVVMFGSELSTGLDNKQFMKNSDYLLTGKTGSNKRTKIIMEEFLEGINSLGTKIYKILRLHPKQKQKEEERDFGAFDYISQGGDCSKLLYASDLVVGMSSALLAESYLLGTQTLSILPRKIEREWLPVEDIPVAFSKKEIKKYLTSFLLSGKRESRNCCNIKTKNSLFKISKLINDLLKKNDNGAN